MVSRFPTRFARTPFARIPFAPALILALLGTGLASAAEPMDGATFDAYTKGKTLFYGQNGQIYGAEIYMEDRRVRWSFLDGECKDGTWYEDADQICFIYEDRETPQCWTFHKAGDALIARFADVPGATELYEARDSGDEMICLADNLGM